MSDDLVNSDEEQVILGAMWMDPNAIDYVADRITQADFGVGLFGRMFAETLAAHAEGAKAIPFHIASAFAEDPEFNDIGGRRWLFQQTEQNVAIVGLPQFVRSLADRSKRRRLRAELQRADAALSNGLDEAVGIADGALWEAIKGEARSDLEPVAATMDAVFQRIEAARSRSEPVGVMARDFPAYNRLTGGMERGHLIILAGRPGMGKTAVACHVATSVARNGHSVLFVSLEMRAVELGVRMLADQCYTQRGGPAYERLLSGDLSNDEFDRAREVRRQIDALPITTSDNGSITVSRLGAMIRRHKRRCDLTRHPLGLVIVDYLQRVESDQRHRSNYETVTEVSKGLKTAAIDNDVPILALAQLSRAVEQRDDKRPQLSDLRDSGQIEQDADSVLFLYRPEYYLKQVEPDPASTKHHDWQEEMQRASGKLEMIAAKRRNGQTGKDWCHFIGTHQAIRPKDFYSVMDPAL